MGPTAVIPSSHLLSIDNENWSPIVDPGGDKDAPRPTELSPGLREWKVTSPVGEALNIHGLDQLLYLFDTDCSKVAHLVRRLSAGNNDSLRHAPQRHWSPARGVPRGAVAAHVQVSVHEARFRSRSPLCCC